MDTICRIVYSSIGRKVMVAAAGLLLMGFLLSHLAGNMLLLVGENAFNTYARTLTSMPLLPAIELALAAIFLLHMIVSLYLNLTSLQARPVRYEVQATRGGRTLGSRTMVYTALLVGAFLVIHVKTFKYGDSSAVGLYQLVMGYFADWRWTLFYVATMLGLGLHLSHGFWSAFQTFGIDHPKYTPAIKAVGTIFAFAICGAFAFLPVWAFWINGGIR